MRRDCMDFLRDIADAIDQIARFVRGLTYEMLIEDEMRVLAITKAVENMGEAAKRIPNDVCTRYPEIPWGEMARTRDRLAHGYFEVNLPILWAIASEFLPPLGPVIRRAIEDELRARGDDEGDGQ